VFDVAVEPRFDFLSAAYAELFARARATAFQHPHWLDALYRQVVPAVKATPLIVTVRFARDRELAMVLPLVRRRYGALRAIEFADLGVSDYATPVGADAVIAAILADRGACAKLKAALGSFDVLRVQKLRHDCVALERLVGAPERTAMRMSAHAVPLAPDYAQWRAEHISASYRKELDKKSRQLHRKGQIAFTCATEYDAIRATLDKMREYRGPRFGDGDLLQNPIYFDFYLDIATRGRGTLSRLYSITLDGAPIAGVLGLAHKGSLLVILSGFDVANHKNQSLGSLTFEMVAHHCIEMGDTELDFTIGDEPYKSLFGARATPVYQIARSGSVLGAVAGKAVEQLPWLKNVAKRVFQTGRSAAIAVPAREGTQA
jgi:CelD/BcsL family acetyltransferase involved in cellulose biosynthesis